MIDIFNAFYHGKRVLVTGHTGFKGSWLSIWLHELGAEVIGVAQDPFTERDNFVLSGRTGYFNIEYFPDNEALRVRHEQDMRDWPLITESGRIVSGYLPLVPVTPKSCYRAYVRI